MHGRGHDLLFPDSVDFPRPRKFLIPLMIGAKAWLFSEDHLSELVHLHRWRLFCSVFLRHGGLDTGWTFYTPLSSVYSNSAVTACGHRIFINGFSTISQPHFIVTIHTMRAPV